MSRPEDYFQTQCYGSQSGIRDPVPFWTQDPGSWMGKKSRSGSGINVPDLISESLEKHFWVKILKILWCGSGSGIRNIFDPGSRIRKLFDPGSGMDPVWKNSDLQHCSNLKKVSPEPVNAGLLVPAPLHGVDPLRGLCSLRRGERRGVAGVDPGGGAGAEPAPPPRLPPLEPLRGTPLHGHACASWHAAPRIPASVCTLYISSSRIQKKICFYIIVGSVVDPEWFFSDIIYGS